VLAFGLLVVYVPESSEAGMRTCYCTWGKTRTSRSCSEACGRTRVRRSSSRRSGAGGGSTEIETHRAQRARSAAGYGYRRRAPVPTQENLGNLTGEVSTDLKGVFCSEGEVIFPKDADAAAKAFCRAQQNKR
jgi:hypothetical protein